MNKSPPILGGVEARKSFGGGKRRLQTQDGQALPRSTTPPEGLTAFSSPPDPGGEFFTPSGSLGLALFQFLHTFLPSAGERLEQVKQKRFIFRIVRSVRVGDRPLASKEYGWNGQTLWIDASFNEVTSLTLELAGAQ